MISKTPENASPAISTVIPLYNAKDTIQATINSVLTQSFDDYEIIVVNDASTDDISDIIQTWDDPRITIVHHKTNKGAAAARNTGIKNAKGKYVAFLDSDDVWFPSKLEKQFEFMENAAVNIKASCSSFEMQRDNGNIGTRILSNKKNWNEEILGGCMVSPGSTLIAHRDLFENNEIGPYPEDMRRLEDWDWLLNYSYKYTLAVIEEPLAQVIVNGYPKYETVKKDAQTLLNKQEEKILQFYNKKQLGYFKAGLEIEKSGTAFRNGNYIRAGLHMIDVCMKSPRRALSLLQRIVVKLAKRDYGRFSQKIK